MIGTMLSNRYQVDSELSRGGMGIVYRGHDLRLDRDVAIKVIDTKALGSEGNARLFQEARVIAQLVISRNSEAGKQALYRPLGIIEVYRIFAPVPALVLTG